MRPDGTRDDANGIRQFNAGTGGGDGVLLPTVAIHPNSQVRAAAFGVKLSFAEHAKVGIPVTVLSMAFAVCWLAYNTDATRIEVPGVITWERARGGDEPGTSRQSRRIPTDPPECTTSGPSTSTMPSAIDY